MDYILEGVIFVWFIFITFRIGELQNQVDELKNNGKKVEQVENLMKTKSKRKVEVKKKVGKKKAVKGKKKK
jgi:TctA family transporter